MPASGNAPMCSPRQCCLRLLRLQRLCAETGLDAILIVLGIDGGFNLGSHQLAGYLLQGCCGRGILDCVKLDDDLEDDFIVIRPNELYIYSNTPDVTQLSAVFRPYCSNVTIVVPSEVQASNPENLEELKVASLVQSLVGVTRVGISLAPEVEQCALQNGNVHIIEQWPLIQAYGLEGVGRPGFFTANFEVCNIYPALQDVYAKLDGWSLQDLLSNGVANLKQHCVEFKRNVMHKLPRSKGDATEKQLAEPLLSYFTYGTLRRTVGVGAVTVMQPRVLCGSRTNSSSEMTGDVQLCDADPSTGQSPVHLVMEAADPHSPLRAARTYFLSAGKTCADIFSDEDELHDALPGAGSEEEADRQHDAVQLMRLYALLARAALHCMAHFALQEGATVDSARTLLLDKLAADLAAWPAIALSRPQLEQQVVLALWSCDHANNVTTAALRGSFQLKVLRVALRDIRSTAPGHPGALLGAVVYADTFIEIPAGCGRGARMVNLTQTIPVIATSTSSGPELLARLRGLKAFSTKLQQLSQARQSSRMDAVLHINRRIPADGGAIKSKDGVPGGEQVVTSLGALLSVGGGDDCVVLTGSPAACVQAGMMYFFTYGFVFLPRTSPMLVVDVRHDVQAITMQELQAPDAHHLPSLGEAIVFKCKQPSAGWAPACHLSDNLHVALPLGSYSQGLRRNLLGSVLPAWQQACREAGVPHVRDAAAPQPFPCYQYPCQWFEVHKGTKRWGVTLSDQEVDDILHTLDDMEVLENGWHDPTMEALLLNTPRPQTPAAGTSNGNSAAHTSARTGAGRPAGQAAPAAAASAAAPAAGGQPGAWVSLVTGLPGSTQLLVAGVISSVSSAAGEQCQVVCLPLRGRPWLEQEELDQALEPLLSGSSTRGAVPHVVLAVSCFDDLSTQLALLSRCPWVVSGRAQLRSCVTCITAHGFYDGDAKLQPLPGGLEQVAHGLVDAVVLSGLQTGSLEELLQQRAPGVPIVRATWAQLMAAREQILPPPAERLAALAAAPAALGRCWAAPVPGRRRRLLAGPLQASFAACHGGRVDLNTLKSLLQELGLDKNASSKCAAALPLREAPVPEQCPYPVFARALLRVGGCAAAAAAVQEVVAWRNVGAIVRNRDSNIDSDLVHLQPPTTAAAAAAATAARAPPPAASPSTNATPPSSKHTPAAPSPAPATPAAAAAAAAPTPPQSHRSSCDEDVECSAQLVIYGTALPPGLAEQLLRGAQPGAMLPSAPTRRCPSSLTPEERRYIRQNRLWDPLPDGWYFSGAMYVDEFGESRDTHPSMDAFVEEYLQQQHELALAQHAQQACQANGFSPLVFHDAAWWSACAATPPGMPDGLLGE